MSLESQLHEADEEVQMAHAMKGDIAQRLHAATEASSSNSEYDVFLSFRGLDTRKKFTDHLYKALTEGGYRTFRDDNGIERGENIKSELQKAIRKSRMSVMVLSKNYANSTACLFELQTILEHQKTSDHKILPVFYDVDPSEIKEQAEKLDFKKTTIEQVKEWSSSFKEVAIEQVKAWSAALKEVASMAGIVSQNQSNGYEATLIEDILDCIHNKIYHDFPRVQDIKRLKNGILCKSISTGVRTSQLRKESLSTLPGYHISLGKLWHDLDGMKEYLLAQAKDVRAKVHGEMLNMWKKPKNEVEVWLRDVESWKGGVQRLHQEVFRESRVHSRVQLRIIEEKTQEKIQEAAELQEKGRAFNDNLLVAFPIDRVLLMPPTNLESVEARNAERIRGYLRETLRETLSVM